MQQSGVAPISVTFTFKMPRGQSNRGCWSCIDIIDRSGLCQCATCNVSLCGGIREIQMASVQVMYKDDSNLQQVQRGRLRVDYVPTVRRRLAKLRSDIINIYMIKKIINLPSIKFKIHKVQSLYESPQPLSTLFSRELSALVFFLVCHVHQLVRSTALTWFFWLGFRQVCVVVGLHRGEKRSKERRGHTVAVSCGVSNTISCSLPMSEGGSTEVLFFRWLALTQLTPARWASFRLLCLNIVTTLLCVWVNQLKRWVGRGFGLWSSAYPCVALVP